jgi:hypothetical protein
VEASATASPYSSRSWAGDLRVINRLRSFKSPLPARRVTGVRVGTSSRIW